MLVIGGISASLVNFRGPLIRSILAHGHEVVACSGEPDVGAIEKLRGWGVEYYPVSLTRAGIQPWEDLRTCWELARLIRKVRAEVVLAYTIKPVIWGGIAARLAGVKRAYSMITGLGYAFAAGNTPRGRLVHFAATNLYRLSLLESRRVFFQNPDDLQVFVARSLVRREQAQLVNGSGVDLVHYGRAPLTLKPRFLMICRLLAQKGVREYVRAAKIVKREYPYARFSLAGPLDTNPDAISAEELNEWKGRGIVDYLGALQDVRPALRDCNVYVLPSYYPEGTPRTVLEAMAMGRPVITSNAPGCRETVEMHDGQALDEKSEETLTGKNGYLVPAKDPRRLAEAMEKFIVDPGLMERMGSWSRRIAESKYDVELVNATILEAMGLA